VTLPPHAGTRCELTVGNGSAAFKANILRQLTLVDPRFQQLVLVVRAWARRQEILDGKDGCLNFPCIILMVRSSSPLSRTRQTLGGNSLHPAISDLDERWVGGKHSEGLAFDS